MAPLTPSVIAVGPVEVPTALDFPQASGPPVTDDAIQYWSGAGVLRPTRLGERTWSLYNKTIQLRWELVTGSFATATTFNANREELYNNIAGGTGFNALLAAVSSTNVFRSNNTQAGIFFSQSDVCALNIAATETITTTLPQSVLASATGDLLLNNCTLEVRQDDNQTFWFWVDTARDDVVSGGPVTGVTGFAYDEFFAWGHIRYGGSTGTTAPTSGSILDIYGNRFNLSAATMGMATWPAYEVQSGGAFAVRSNQAFGTGFPEFRDWQFIAADSYLVNIPYDDRHTLVGDTSFVVSGPDNG